MPGRPGNAALSWSVVAFLAAGAAMRPACVEPTDDLGFDARPMLESLPDAVIHPALAEAVDAATSLSAATDAWLAARGAGDGAEQLAIAQDAWRAAMAKWQVVEVLQIGPAASSTTAVGGQDLRDEVHSWPTVNPCRVDQELVEEGYGAPGFFDDNLVNVYGLDALEYLLFHPVGNACANQHPINEDGSWDALGESEVGDRLAAYASVAAAGVVEAIEGIEDAWDPAGGDFDGQFRGAGEDGSVYSTELSAVNAVFDALFYLELETKDAKLGVPLGINPGCGVPPCADLLESPWAQGSRDHIAANLLGFRALYTGGEGLGFDDLLVSLDEGALNEAVLAALDAADAEVARSDEPLASALATDLASVQALHAAIKGVSDLLKNDLAAVLVLQIPNEAGGDND